MHYWLLSQRNQLFVVSNKIFVSLLFATYDRNVIGISMNQNAKKKWKDNIMYNQAATIK